MWHIVKCSLNCLNFIIMSPCCSRSSSCTYVFIFYYSQIVNHLHLHEEVRASCQLGFSIFSYLWCIFVSYMMCMFLLFYNRKREVSWHDTVSEVRMWNLKSFLGVSLWCWLLQEVGHRGLWETTINRPVRVSSVAETRRCVFRYGFHVYVKSSAHKIRLLPFSFLPT